MVAVHTERELKYDVDDGFQLPPLLGLITGPDGATPLVQGRPVVHQLEATYFDTADLRLARARLTLRRRIGGEDAGWHLKVPGADGARQEVRLPLGRSDGVVPGQLRELVWVRTRGLVLAPVARIVTERTVQPLLDASGEVLLEVADDRVRAERLSSSDTSSAIVWRELEVELRGADREWLDRVDAALRDLGLRASASGSKLARVLSDSGIPGTGTRGMSGSRLSPAKASAGRVVLQYVEQQVHQILRHDPLVRLDAADSIHRMRVATRRLRSTLQTFASVLQVADMQLLHVELKWLAGELGVARDAEVMRLRMLAAVKEAGDHADLGTLTDTIDTELSQDYQTAHAGLIRTLNSQRYRELVTVLDKLASAPPLTADADPPADQELARSAARTYSRLRKLVKAVHRTTSARERDAHLHDARKAAKKARYAGEALTGGFGEPAARFAAAMEALQEELGVHQDTVVMRSRLEDLARHAESSEAAFAYGRLHAREEARGELAVARFQDAWRSAKKKSVRSWMT